MNTKKYSLSMGKIFLMVVLFLFIGFIIGRHDDSLKDDFITNLFYPVKNEKKKSKLVKTKNGKVLSKQKQKHHAKVQ